MKEDLIEIIFKHCENDNLNYVSVATAVDEIINIHISKLEKYKNDTKGLTVVDCEADKILHKFWNSKSDICCLEATEQERQEKEFQKWIRKHSWVL